MLMAFNVRGRSFELETRTGPQQSRCYPLSVPVLSLKSDSEPALTRANGVYVVAMVLIGFLAGQVLALAMLLLFRAITGSTLTLTQIAHLSTAPWWAVVSQLLGIWMGMAMTVFIVQRQRPAFQWRSVFTFAVNDFQFILWGIGLQFLVIWIYYLVHAGGSNGPSHKLLGGSSGAGLVLVSLCTAVGAPIVEETFFRGVLVRGLRALVRLRSERATFVVVAVLDGALFAAAHAEWLQFPGLMAVGIVLASLFMWTRRLWPGIVVHMSFNTVAVIAVLASRGH